jgi:hypothetical protein
VKAAEPRTLSGWVIENAVVILTLAGAGFYTALRVAHQTFYRTFGLTPEDVGLGYGEALARAAGLAFYLSLAALSIGFSIFKVRDLFFTGAWGRFFRVQWAALLMTIILGFVVFLAGQARSAANDVRSGHNVRPYFFLDTGIHAERATITWLGDAPRPLADVPTHRLMFMGESGGSVVLYDVDVKRSIRIPSSNVGVSILP